MGVLQRFERRLEGLIEGAFAKVFRGGVEPVEIAKALQREAAGHRAISATRTLVPNDYVVELGPADYAKLSPYAEPLGAELAAMVREQAAEERWAFVGPVRVSLEKHADVPTGTFRLRSGVVTGEVEPLPTPPLRGKPRVRLVETPQGQPTTVPFDHDTLLIGRASDARIRLADTGVSRRHAELRREGDDVIFVDLGSTNGSLVNGRAVERIRLKSGDRIEIGRSIMIFERDDA